MGADLSYFYQNNGFKKGKKLAYGTYKNRPVSVLFMTSMVKVIISFNQQIVQDTGKAISEKMSEIKHSYSMVSNIITSNINIEMYLYQSCDLDEKFAEVLDKIMAVLDGFNLKTCEMCPICGQLLTPNDPDIRIGDAVFKAHEKCVDGLIGASEAFEGNIKKDSKKQTLKSVLICFFSFVILTSLSVLLASNGITSIGLLFSGVLTMTLIRFFMAKSKIINDNKNLIIRSIFACLSLILSIVITLFVIYYKVFNDNIFKTFFIHFKETFSDGIIDSKLYIYDFLSGFILLSLSIFMDYKFVNAQRKKIYKLQ